MKTAINKITTDERLRRFGLFVIAFFIANLYFVQQSFATNIATWSNPNLGTTNWCAGETRTISITVKNSGTSPWVFNGTNPVRIGATWDADVSYPYRTNMTANVAAGSSVTLSIVVTAPAASGTHVLHIDMVQEGVCWFAGFASGACNAGSLRFDSPNQTVLATPTASISGTVGVCQNGTLPNITFTNPQTSPVTVTYNINGSNQATINIGAGTNASLPAPTATVGTFNYNLVSVAYQATPTCSNSIPGTATVTVNALPTAFSVTGGGGYCSGGTGVTVGLGNSQSGVNYQLQLNGVNTGSPVAGTGSPISFGNQTIAGTYTVVAKNATTLCSSTMAGNTTVTINSIPVSSVTNQSNITCFAANDGTITVSASGGLTPYTFSVDNGTNYLPATGTDLRLFTSLLPNTAYRIKVKDSNGCISK